MKNIDFTLKTAVSVMPQGHIKSVDSLEYFTTLSNDLKQGDLTLYQASLWMADVEFGQQMLNGVNPVVIRGCTIDFLPTSRSPMICEAFSHTWGDT